MMLHENFSDKIIEDINLIRKDPSSSLKRFDLVKLVMKRLKASEILIKDFENFVHLLAENTSHQPLEVSKGLQRAAEKQLDIYLKNEYVKNAKPEEVEFRCKEFAKGFTKLFQVSDMGADDAQGVVNRLMMSNLDFDKISRRILMDFNLKYIGVAHRVIKEENIVVIICADNVEDVELKETVQGAFQYLNSIRTRPIEHIESFVKFSNNDINKKKVFNEINNLINFLKSIKSKPLHALTENDILKELAQGISDNLETFINISGQDESDAEIKKFASISYSHFNNLSFYVNKGERNGEKIINEILFDANGRKKFLETLENKRIGIVSNEKYDNSFVTVLVVADEIEAGPNIAFEENFIEELNKFRENPNIIVKSLTDYKNNQKRFYASFKKDLIKDVEGFISQLTKRSSRPDIQNLSLSKLQINHGLQEAAKEYFDHLDQSSIKTFYAQDDEYLKISLSHYITGFSKFFQFVLTGPIKVENILLDLLICEKDENNRSRKVMLDNDVLYAGAYQGLIRGKRVTIIMFTDVADEVLPKPFVEELLEQINNIRAHPRSYMKYISKIIDEGKFPESMRWKIEKDTYVQDLSEFLNFLNNTRTFGPFIFNEDLRSAAENRLETRSDNLNRSSGSSFFKSSEGFTQRSGSGNSFFKSKEEPTPKSSASLLKKIKEDEFKAFLSDYGSEYNFTEQIETRGNDSPRDLLMSLLTGANDLTKVYRSIIFSKKLNFIGIARSKENEDILSISCNASAISDQKSVLIFADKFEPTLKNLKISIHNHRRRLHRPNFTDDEIFQIKKDFKLFDVLNTGFIKPEIIQVFMNTTKGYSERNPVYFDAIQNLNTEENNSNGVDVEEFINAVAVVLKNVNDEARWYELFNSFQGENKKKIIDVSLMKSVTNELGYRMSDEEIEEIMNRLADGGKISSEKFGELLTIVENTFKSK